MAVGMWKHLNNTIVSGLNEIKWGGSYFLIFLLLSPNVWNEGMTKNELCYKNGSIISNLAAQNSFQFEPRAVALKNLFP